MFQFYKPNQVVNAMNQVIYGQQQYFYLTEQQRQIIKSEFQAELVSCQLPGTKQLFEGLNMLNKYQYNIVLSNLTYIDIQLLNLQLISLKLEEQPLLVVQTNQPTADILKAHANQTICFQHSVARDEIAIKLPTLQQLELIKRLVVTKQATVKLQQVAEIVDGSKLLCVQLLQKAQPDCFTNFQQIYQLLFKSDQKVKLFQYNGSYYCNTFGVSVQQVRQILLQYYKQQKININEPTITFHNFSEKYTFKVSLVENSVLFQQFIQKTKIYCDFDQQFFQTFTKQLVSKPQFIIQLKHTNPTNMNQRQYIENTMTSTFKSIVANMHNIQYKIILKLMRQEFVNIFTKEENYFFDADGELQSNLQCYIENNCNQINIFLNLFDYAKLYGFLREICVNYKMTLFLGVEPQFIKQIGSFKMTTRKQFRPQTLQAGYLQYQNDQLLIQQRLQQQIALKSQNFQQYQQQQLLQYQIMQQEQLKQKQFYQQQLKQQKIQQQQKQSSQTNEQANNDLPPGLVEEIVKESPKQTDSSVSDQHIIANTTQQAQQRIYMYDLIRFVQKQQLKLKSGWQLVFVKKLNDHSIECGLKNKKICVLKQCNDISLIEADITEIPAVHGEEVIII